MEKLHPKPREERVMGKSPYLKLAEKIDMNVTGAPKRGDDFSPAFMKYLEILYTPEEAEVASYLSVDPKRLSAEDVAEQAGRSAEEIEKALAQLVEKEGIDAISVAGNIVLPALFG